MIISKPKKKKKRVYEDEDDCLDVDINALAAKEKKEEVEKKHEDDKKSGKLEKFKTFQEGKEKRLAEKIAMRSNLNFSERKKLSKTERAYLKKIDEQQRLLKELNKAFKIIEVIDEDLLKTDESRESLPKELQRYKDKYYQMKHMLNRQEKRNERMSKRMR